MNLLAHRLDGAGPPLLLLNGGLMSYTAWDSLLPALAARHRVIRCDLRGQLRSPGPAHATVEGHVADLVALLDHLDVTRAHVVGTSFGALVGVALAALAPARVASLVATTVGPVATPELAGHARTLADACRAAAAGGHAAGVIELIAGALYAPDYVAAHRSDFAERAHQLGALPPAWWSGVVGILDALERFDLRPLLPRVAIPTLVLAAELDLLFPPEQGRSLANAIAGARFAVVSGSGHVLIQERPEEFIRHCLDFISSLVGSRECGEASAFPGYQPPEGVIE
jgi:pimeloyl-ACP methyl ester carboxylesterase